MLRFVQLFRGVAIIFETIERHWISTISKNPLFTFKKINLHPNISCFVMEIEYKNLCKNNLFILLFNEIHYQKWKMSGNIAFKTLSKLPLISANFGWATVSWSILFNKIN